MQQLNVVKIPRIARRAGRHLDSAIHRVLYPLYSLRVVNNNYSVKYPYLIEYRVCEEITATMLEDLLHIKYKDRVISLPYPAYGDNYVWQGLPITTDELKVIEKCIPYEEKYKHHPLFHRNLYTLTYDLQHSLKDHELCSKVQDAIVNQVGTHIQDDEAFEGAYASFTILVDCMPDTDEACIYLVVKRLTILKQSKWEKITKYLKDRYLLDNYIEYPIRKAHMLVRQYNIPKAMLYQYLTVFKLGLT